MNHKSLSTLPILFFLLRIEVIFPFLAFQAYSRTADSLTLPIIVGIVFVFLNMIAERKFYGKEELSSKLLLLVRWAGYNALVMAAGTLVVSCIVSYSSGGIDFSKLYVVAVMFGAMWLFLSALRIAAVFTGYSAQKIDVKGY